MKNERRDLSIRVERLTESYRFDDELATLLTQFQYREDGIRLTAAEKRPVPSTAYDASTAGLDAVLASDSSLVFICYDERGHRMVNSVETILIHAIIDAVETAATTARPDGGTTAPLGEGPEQPSPDEKHHAEEQPPDADRSQSSNPSVGVVTPHNAQRGALDTRLPDDIMANTVEKYQGGERDIITVSGTVSDPEFARREERFILNPRRLLVAISRSRLLTVVVCSTALFEVAPDDSERLDDGPVWARLFTQAVGRDAEPAWAGLLGEFGGDDKIEHAAVPVQVYPSTIDVADGDQ